MAGGSSKANVAFTNSMTDLMTSLAVMVILLLVVYIDRSYREMQKTMQEMRSGAQAVKVELMNSLKISNIDAENDPDDPLALIIRVRDDDLQFDVNKAALRGGGKGFLRDFIPKLLSVISNKKYAKDIESVLIAGHTDSDGNDEHNLKLSQARAFTVLRISMNETSLDNYKRDFLLDKASTNGRGERDLLPYGCEGGSEDKAQSRRVEFKIELCSKVVFHKMKKAAYP